MIIIIIIGINDHILQNTLFFNPVFLLRGIKSTPGIDSLDSHNSWNQNRSRIPPKKSLESNP